MTYKYKLPDDTYISENQQFTLGSGNNKLLYPANWLELPTAEDRSNAGLTRELVINPPPSADDIVAAQTKQILAAFLYMEAKLEQVVISIPVVSESNALRPFGCDKITQDNIVGINCALAVGIPVPNPTKWTPKGYPSPVLVSHTELVMIGASILNKKNELYQIYFGHKAALMMSSNYDEIMAHDYTTGYI